MATLAEPSPVKQDYVTEDVESPEKAIGESEHIDGTVRLYDSQGNVRKIPIPTDSPADPLTWPSWKRWLIVMVLCIYGVAGFAIVQSTPLFFGDIIAEYKKQTRGTFDAANISQLASYPSLCMGIGNFLFVPLSMMLGRRAIFLFNNSMMLAALIWAAKSQNFNSHLGARCLQGLACGIGDCLLPLIILDITFLHRRGFWMSFYWAVTAASSSVFLITVPYVVQGSGLDWRLSYWYWLAFSAFSLIVAIFFLPETLFTRAPALIDGQIAITDSYGNVSFIAPEDAPGLVPKSDYIATAQNTSYFKQLLPLHFQGKIGIRRFYMSYVEMGLSLLHPSILYALILNSILFGGLVALSLTYATQLTLKPWLFSHAAVGTAQVGSFFGALIALAISGSTVDKISAFLTRRNNGIREPEHLLPNFILPTLLAFGGLCLYGSIAGNPENHPGAGWMGIHVSFAMYYCGFVALSAISGAWIAEATPHWSGPGLVLVCGGRNALSFAISNNFELWIEHQGFQNAHIQLGSALLGVVIVGGIPLFIWNKGIRRAWGKWLRFDTN